ncbi:MAG: DotU family type VI secretion system protein [Betaproteobacteria bacterium]
MAQSQGATPVDLPEIVSGTNPLVAAANPLLNLIPQLRATVQHPDPAKIRDFLVDQIQAFELRARAAGIPSEQVIGARYCLCTALDETAAQTPWGGSGVWSRHSLLVTFHNETWGGEKFFQLLAKLAQNPQQHGQLLELMYYCLALGLEGRFRIVDNGRTQLETLKQRLALIIRQQRGEYERPLSLHWAGVTTVAKRGWENMPLWVAASLSALIAFGLYFWFAFSLNGTSDNIRTAIAGIRAPELVRPNPPAPAALPRFAKFLEPEIKAGLVTVNDLADRSVVILRGDGLFDPGQTVVKPQYVNVMGRIAEALNEVPGQVLVTGYTDNQPIRTVRFPSNWHLSQERADVVKGMLDTRITGKYAAPNRVRAEGRAESEPVAANDTPENRARNRRVEVTLLVAPTETARQMPASEAIPAAAAPAAPARK